MSLLIPRKVVEKVVKKRCQPIIFYFVFLKSTGNYNSETSIFK